MPVIAVSQNRRLTDYLESVRRAGGTPLEVGAGAEDAAAIVSRVDGVLLTGGDDVEPGLYGEAAHATFTASEPGRDTFEIALVRAAIAADVPLLAICRGTQVLNVALGGSLVQDIPSQVTGALEHSIPEPRFAVAHDVWVSRGSRLWTIMRETLDGESLSVNSRHHQAVNRLGEGLEATATAPDGVIETIERAASRFCIGVQWHPENFWRTGEFRALFEHFIEAARQTRPK
ncbi:MAG: gamma-glutamyl-gamma-aminobutyrate hydrolase family protein [Acidobacteria bacterium]|nr:gamma-glutamyl-gamma-aminobutyrate hydrolase family protein [Acidobacteriota bacterium]